MRHFQQVLAFEFPVFPDGFKALAKLCALGRVVGHSRVALAQRWIDKWQRQRELLTLNAVLGSECDKVRPNKVRVSPKVVEVAEKAALVCVEDGLADAGLEEGHNGFSVHRLNVRPS